jgi:hypothetical protein
VDIWNYFHWFTPLICKSILLQKKNVIKPGSLLRYKLCLTVTPGRRNPDIQTEENELD